MDHFYTRNKFVRVALTLLAMFCFSWTFAEDITAEQAMQLARTFVSGQKSIPGQHNSTGMTPQLTQAKKVSGLYVFNVANNGGFIIVSNDDRTTPILGFSESGNLDPDNMPSNMRAWLQGYADEIAWMQKHDVKPNRLSKAPLSVGSHKTDDIAPMVKTKWNQGSPYNNLCPIYSGSSRSVTGCVATAMAQVMKYHEWPKDETKSIPGYTTSGYKLTLDGLDPVTFDWANMLNVYGTSATAAQKTAVATLMKYCGYSVKMNYGPSSGAYTQAVAIGPMIMMKFTTLTAKKLGLPIVVSLNTLMVDGTGMCGACRVSVGGKTRFACVEGPEFDGYEVDFDEAMRRQGQYRTEEAEAREKHVCRIGRG